MFKNLLNNYDKGKSKKLKLIALCIKAVTGVVGGSLVISTDHPYLAIAVLAAGAVANEIINFINKEEDSDSNSDNGSLPPTPPSPPSPPSA